METFPEDFSIKHSEKKLMDKYSSCEELFNARKYIMDQYNEAIDSGCQYMLLDLEKYHPIVRELIMKEVTERFVDVGYFANYSSTTPVTIPYNTSVQYPIGSFVTATWSVPTTYTDTLPIISQNNRRKILKVSQINQDQTEYIVALTEKIGKVLFSSDFIEKKIEK